MLQTQHLGMSLQDVDFNQNQQCQIAKTESNVGCNSKSSLLHGLSSLLLRLGFQRLLSGFLLATLLLVILQILIKHGSCGTGLATISHIADQVFVKLCSLPFISLACDILFLFVGQIFPLLALREEAWSSVIPVTPASASTAAPTPTPTSATSPSLVVAPDEAGSVLLFLRLSIRTNSACQVFRHMFLKRSSLTHLPRDPLPPRPPPPPRPPLLDLYIPSLALYTVTTLVGPPPLLRLPRLPGGSPPRAPWRGMSA